MRTFSLTLLALLGLLGLPGSAGAAPEIKPLISLTTSDSSSLIKTFDGWLQKLPGGGGAALPRELKAAMAKLRQLPLSGPGALALLRRSKGKERTVLAVEQHSPAPKRLRKGLVQVLGKEVTRLLRPVATANGVRMQSNGLAGKWLRARLKPNKTASGKPARFSFTIHLDNFVPARRGLESPGPLLIAGELPHRWNTTAGPAVARAVRPLLGRPATPDLGLLPAGVELIAAGKIGGHGKLLRQMIGSREATKLFPALTGEGYVARMADSATALRAGLFLRFSPGKARDAADRIFAEVKKNIPWWRKVLKEEGIKAHKVKEDHYALIYPISLTQRAAAAAMGIKVPFPLIVRWAQRGDYLVVTTDEAFLSSKDRFDSKLPGKLKGATAWSWHVTRGQLSRLTWTPARLRMESDALSARGDRVNMIIASLPSLLLSWAIKQRVVEAFKIPASSMAPAILQGDHIWVDRRLAGKAPRKGDIVVFRSPRDPRKDFIKRVVAVAGDKARMVDLEIWKKKGKGKRTSKDKTITVPRGHVFLVGDNKKKSFDSRHFGPVKISAIKGRAVSVLWSMGEDGKIRWKRIGLPVK